MAKIFLVKRIEKDWWGCYYEGDKPSETTTIVEFGKTYEEGREKGDAHLKLHGKKKLAKGLYFNSEHNVDVDYEIEEVDIPNYLIEYLWKHKDE